jgi:hypothetical protein
MFLLVPPAPPPPPLGLSRQPSDAMAPKRKRKLPSDSEGVTPRKPVPVLRGDGLILHDARTGSSAPTLCERPRLLRRVHIQNVRLFRAVQLVCSISYAAALTWGYLITDPERLTSSHVLGAHGPMAG